MKINQVAKLTGITVRTLHYYDEIGLLKPSEITKGGYRLYDEAALGKLQQILFFRELDFPLGEIKQIISSPSFDKRSALKKHKELLLKKRERLDRLVDLVNEIIKGDNKMSFKEFNSTEIEEIKAKYIDEAKERWGNTEAFAQSEQKTATYGKGDWKQLWAEGNQILKTFSLHIGEAPESDEVQQLVKQWQDFITDKFYHCTREILQGLGEMYVSDNRFKENIDQNGIGTAAFMAQAIRIYCAK